MTDDERVGILLINTGSSSAPRAAETRVYLREFLGDPRIIDIPAWKRWLIVNCFILPFRPKQTAEAYEAVWTERGSPLISFSEDFRDALAKELPQCVITIGMAYGEPKIGAAIEELMAADVSRIILVPMFPQYASATTGSVLNGAYAHACKRWNVPSYSVLPPYYKDAGYIEAWEEVARPVLDDFKPDHVLLSFHGLPERQIYKGDPTGQHCLKQENCCGQSVPANRYCYRHHCMETSRAIAEKLGLGEGEYTVTFQSRLGKDPWLEPATDAMLAQKGREGVKRLAVLSPAFVADCLETLEEIGMQGKESFLEHGGEDFVLVPSLNAHPRWVRAMAEMLRKY